MSTKLLFSMVLCPALVLSSGCANTEADKPPFEIVFTKEPSTRGYIRPALSVSVSANIQGTPQGDYISRMVDSINGDWYKLLRTQTNRLIGKVVLHFRLHSDGSISDMKVVSNEVSEVLAKLCVQAVQDLAPYPEWPRQMRVDLPSDDYPITLTFIYEP
jgi:outer membrane biosynthesis protein TonB